MTNLQLERKVVAPGDLLLDLPDSGKLRIGSGILVDQNQLLATKCGVTQQTKAGKIWLAGRQKRYIPAEGDSVIGVITDRFGEGWNVNIRGPFTASLGALSFEGVTRRSRPNLRQGDLVYARVKQAPRDADPEIVCTDADGQASGFGQLKDGYLSECSTSLARTLLGKPTAPILSALGSAVQYEIAIGLNGRLWVNAQNTTTAVLVANAILHSEFLTAAQCSILVKKLVAVAVKGNQEQ